MKSRLFAIALSTLLCMTATAQQEENAPLNVLLETRADYQRDYLDGKLVDDNTGFKGKYLNIKLTGNITDDISYVFEQRLNKMHANTNFFDATDFIYLNWQATDNLSLSAGKQVVAIGGFEYDRAPINLYFFSEFWNNIGCYQWGASATYSFNQDRDNLLFQFCESPFRSHSQYEAYAYNLMWRGSHGPLSTIWSFNMSEYDKGKYISYISLGNEVSLSKSLKTQIDFINRASKHQNYWLDDYSLMAELSFKPNQKFNVFAKATYDVNKTENNADYTVLPGTEMTSVGGGLEYFPLGTNQVRLHVNYSYSFGKNGNPEGALPDKQSLFDVGLTWRLDWHPFNH